MGFKDYLRNMLIEADQPLPEFSGQWNVVKSGKVRIVLIYEDKSFKEYYIKLGDGFTTTIKKRRYFIIPECVIRGKFPTLIFFFNNPYPINLDYQPSQLTSEKLYSKNDFDKLDKNMQHTLTNTYIDASSLQAAFSSNLINKMYLENRMTAKNAIIIIVVVLIVILILLHAFGVIDLYQLISGVPSGGK